MKSNLWFYFILLGATEIVGEEQRVFTAEKVGQMHSLEMHGFL